MREAGVHLTLFFLPVHFVALGFDGATIGMLVGLWGLSGLALVLPSGWLNDGLPSRHLAVTGLGAASAGYFLFSFTESVALLIPLLFWLGMADNLARTSIQTLALRYLPAEREAALGLLNSARTAGMAAGLLSACLLLSVLPFTRLFQIAAGVFFILSLLAVRLPAVAVTFQSLREYRGDLLRGDVLRYLLLMALVGQHWGAEHTAYALFLRETLQLTWQQTGWFMAPPILTLSVSSFFCGRYLSRGGKVKTLFAGGLFFSGVGHLVMAWPEITTQLAFAARLVHETGDGALLVTMLVGIARFFPAARIGGMSAVVTVVVLGAAFMSSLAYAPLGKAYGYGWPLGISGLFLLLSIPLSAWAGREEGITL